MTEKGQFEKTAEALAAELTLRTRRYGYDVRATYFFEPGGCVAMLEVCRADSDWRFVAELCRSDLVRDGSVEGAYESMLARYGSSREWGITVPVNGVDIRLPGATSAEELRLKEAVEGCSAERTSR